MEKKKSVNSNYGILVILMFAIICTLADYIIIERSLRKYESNNNADNRTSCINTNVNNGASNIDNSIITGDEIDSSNSRFNAYVSKLKSERQRIYEENSLLSSTIEGNNIIEVKFYTVELSSDGELSVSFFNDGQDKDVRKIADDVLGYSVLYYGNGGFRGLYIIFNDGSVGFVNVEYDYINDEELTVKKDKNFKNIISIVQGSYNDGLSGSSGAIYIDIDGNIYK